MAGNKYIVERVQTGVRMEKRLLKVLRAFADYRDLTLGDLLEGIVLHAFEGRCPFNEESLERIKELRKFYGLDLDAGASHRLTEADAARPPKKRKATNDTTTQDGSSTVGRSSAGRKVNRGALHE
jgi:hypothetical protein